jgi:hypothetical protein
VADLNFTIKDSTGSTQTFRGTDDGTGKVIPIHEASASEAHIGEVGGRLKFVYNSFIRPNNATPYTAGDVVAANTAAVSWFRLSGVGRVTSGDGYITGVRITTDKKSITPRFRIHMYNDESGLTLAFDNLPYKKIFADEPKYLGYVDLPAMATPADTTNSDISTAQDLNIRIPVTDIGSYLSCQLETLDGFTPAAFQQFLAVVFVDQN